MQLIFVIGTYLIDVISFFFKVLSSLFLFCFDFFQVRSKPSIDWCEQVFWSVYSDDRKND